MRSINNILDLSKEELIALIEKGEDILEHPSIYAHACEGKKLATLFYEPSTRTRLSFTSAMMELGGQVLGFSSASTSSVSKGETIHDTMKVVSNFVDIIATRNPLEGAALVSMEAADVPVINAGDGGHFHPTQTLGDLLCIYKERHSLDNLTLGICGDLLYGRTVHSLLSAFSYFKNIKVVLISPKELALPSFVKENILEKDHMPYEEVSSLEEAIPSLDILYMTRVQKERFASLETYERLKDSYILDAKKMERGKKDLMVLHPLPRVNEISEEVDDDPRAFYFKEVLAGKFMREALILTLLEDAKKNPVKENRRKGLIFLKDHAPCTNPKCVSLAERDLHPTFVVDSEEKHTCHCYYCDKESTF